MLSKLHSKTARWVNRLDGTPSRKVWHNYHETRLTFERSYLARLGYTHRNAVKHGLVPVASQYPWCSAAWFEQNTRTAMVKAICRFKVNKVHVDDEFDVDADW